MSIWKYDNLLPEMPKEAQISLGEGQTPLIQSRWIGPQMEVPNLYFKLESTNPTGSYKDRFAAAAVSDLIRRKSPVCLATSSGNTGSALAAFCAASGIPCLISTVAGTPEGKLLQMQAYGAQVFMIHNFGIEEKISTAVFHELARLAQTYDSPVQISAFKHCPIGMSGVQTIAYELADQMKTDNMHVFSPAGGGGLTLAVAKGFVTLAETKKGFSLPSVHCVQPEGNDTMAGPLRRGEAIGQAIPNSTTAVSGLQVPGVIDANEVIQHCRDSGGTGHIVSDEEVFQVHRTLAVREGVYCEPAGAVALAGVLKAIRTGELDADANIICLVTGIGFKDPAATVRMTQDAECPVLADPTAVAAYLHSKLDGK